MSKEKLTKYENKYYIYFHIDPRTSQVFYVGKGSKLRAWAMCYRRKDHQDWVKSLKIEGFSPIVDIPYVYDTEIEALNQEKLLIPKLRAEGHPLLNFNNGGGGHPAGPSHPNFGKKVSKKTRAKLSKSHLGVLNPKNSEPTRKRMLGNSLRKGKKMPKSAVKSLIARLEGNSYRSIKILCLNNNQIFNSVKEAWKTLKLDERSLYRHLKGEYAHVKGYKFKYL